MAISGARSPMMSRMPSAMMQPRWVWGDTPQRYRDQPWLLLFRSLVVPPSPMPIASVTSPTTSNVAVVAATTWFSSSPRWARRPTSCCDSPTRSRGSKPGREMDLLITAGERKACALVAMALHDVGVPSASFTGSQAGFITDTNHRNAKILEINPTSVSVRPSTRVWFPIVAGSQGVSGPTRTSRSSAVEVPTPQPSRWPMCSKPIRASSTPMCPASSPPTRASCPMPEKCHSISFDELLEMTAVGCPKPAMRSVEVARNYRVPLHVRSAFTWEPGTWVVEEDPEMEQAVVSAVVPDTSEAKVTVCAVCLTNRASQPDSSGRSPRRASTST